MNKYIALYYNTSGKHQEQPQLSPEEYAAVMAPWSEWKDKYAERIVDLGAPISPALASNDGKRWAGSSNLVTGYSIVAANSLEDAKEMFEGHPIYNHGEHAIEISPFASI